MPVNKVFKFGCLPPDNQELALQALGQAFLYREDLRRVHNADKRRRKAAWLASKDSDDNAHVISHYRASNHEQFLEECRATRSASRRGHLIDAGTYWLVEASLAQASKMTKFDPIRPQQWDGTGKIGAAIQASEQFPAPGEWTHNRARLTDFIALTRGRQLAKLSIAVGALAEKRTLTWPVLIHRAFPADAIVKQVAVQRVRNGHRFKWEALVTLEYEEPSRDEGADGCVGVDLGWRVTDGDMRVATADSGDVLLNTSLRSLEYADAVRGTRDTIFDDVKKHAATLDTGETHIHAWKNKDRMRSLLRKTSDFGLAWWNYRDRHLEDIESGVRAKAIRRKRESYRLFADSLAKRFQIVVLEDMAATEFSSATHAKEARRARASIALLQDAIVARFGEARVCWVPAAYTSKTCSKCGTIGALGAEEHWTCHTCGAEHQRDENAAVNIRVRGEQWVDEHLAVRPRSAKPVVKKEKKAKKKSTSREPLAIAA